MPEPTEKELREVIKAAGSLAHRQSPKDEEMVQQTISDYRAERRKRR